MLISEIWAFPPEALFSVVVIPRLSIYWTVFPTPETTKSPCTLCNINSLVFAIDTTESLAPIPREFAPIVPIPRTSPIEYPVPDSVIVAAIATPLLIVMFAFASLPFPVIVVRGTLPNSRVSADGVYPIPELITFKVPVAIPAFPT